MLKHLDLLFYYLVWFSCDTSPLLLNLLSLKTEHIAIYGLLSAYYGIKLMWIKLAKKGTHFLLCLSLCISTCSVYFVNVKQKH